MRCKLRQRGGSLILALFLITGLALLAAVLTRTVVMTSEVSVTELYSAQALYAAESGIEYAVHRIVNPTLAPAAGGSVEAQPLLEVVPGRAWFRVAAERDDDTRIWTITSIGLAGSNSDEPRAQRRVRVLFAE